MTADYGIINVWVDSFGYNNRKIFSDALSAIEVGSIIGTSSPSNDSSQSEIGWFSIGNFNLGYALMMVECSCPAIWGQS